MSATASGCASSITRRCRHDLIDNRLQSFAHFFRSDLHCTRKAIAQLLADKLQLALVSGMSSSLARRVPLQCFRSVFADLQTIVRTHVIANAFVHRVSGRCQTHRRNDTTRSDDRDVCRAATDIDDEMRAFIVESETGPSPARSPSSTDRCDDHRHRARHREPNVVRPQSQSLECRRRNAHSDIAVSSPYR
jgi:hypothetical protein